MASLLRVSTQIFAEKILVSLCICAHYQKHLYIKAKKGLESREATELVIPMVEKTAPTSLDGDKK